MSNAQCIVSFSLDVCANLVWLLLFAWTEKYYARTCDHFAYTFFASLIRILNVLLQYCNCRRDNWKTKMHTFAFISSCTNRLSFVILPPYRYHFVCSRKDVGREMELEFDYLFHVSTIWFDIKRFSRPVATIQSVVHSSLPFQFI